MKLGITLSPRERFAVIFFGHTESIVNLPGAETHWQDRSNHQQPDGHPPLKIQSPAQNTPYPYSLKMRFLTHELLLPLSGDSHFLFQIIKPLAWGKKKEGPAPMLAHL